MENTIGTKLQQLIKEHEQTNAKAAEAIGVSASLISDIINGKKKQGIGADIVKKICEHYHVSSDWLLGIAPCSDERKDFEATLRVTGLSNKAIEKLCQLKKTGLDFESANKYSPYDTELLVVIDAIISDDILLDALRNYFCGSATWWGNDGLLAFYTAPYSRGLNSKENPPSAQEKALNELVNAINMQRLQTVLWDSHKKNSDELMRKVHDIEAEMTKICEEQEDTDAEN